MARLQFVHDDVNGFTHSVNIISLGSVLTLMHDYSSEKEIWKHSVDVTNYMEEEYALNAMNGWADTYTKEGYVETYREV